MGRKGWRGGVGSSIVLLVVFLLGLSLVAPRVEAQFTDRVIVVVYLKIKPEMSNSWLITFKKYLQPALKELENQGALEGWHLFVPYVHHPGYTWTHALVLANKDRGAQGVVDKKLRQVMASIPAEESKAFFAAADPGQHHDDEWLEVDLGAVTVPEPEKEDEGEASKE